MTTSEIERAFHLRLMGKTWAEIGKETGYSIGEARYCIDAVCRNGGCLQHIIYPNLRTYILTHDCYIGEFADRCGISRTHMSNVLRGRTKMTESTLGKIIEATGMDGMAIRERSDEHGMDQDPYPYF